VELPARDRLWKTWKPWGESLWPDRRAKEPADIVASIVHAVQTHNSAEAFATLRQVTFLSQWQDVRVALSQLPRTTISSLFRLVDPVIAGEDIDYTHNMRVDALLQEFSSVNVSMDEFGIRQVYKQLMAVLERFAELVTLSHGPLLPTEYEVLLRCAGATSDTEAAKRVWRLMQSPSDQAGAAFRTARNYEAFIRAKYLTEDLYAQNDPKRTLFRPRNLRGHSDLTRRTKRRLDRHRIHLALASRYKYGHSPTQPERTISWATSGKLPLGRITKSLLKRGILTDEKLSSAILRAKGRTGQARHVFSTMRREFGFHALTTDDHRDPGLTFKTVETSRLLRECSQGYLESIVTALGTLGYPIIARRFLEFYKAEYKTVIPRSAWSIVLKYTFLAQSVRREWEIFSKPGQVRNQVVKPSDVIDVWNAMTAQGLMKQVPFEERNMYIVALIVERRFDEALSEMRKGFDQYREATDAVQHTLIAALYPAPPQSVHMEFLRSKSSQHAMWVDISQWCQMFLWRYTRHVRTSAALTEDVPKLVAEFSEFTDGAINYRTISGMVRLNDDAARTRHQWRKRHYDSPPIEVLAADTDRPVILDDGEPLVNKHSGKLMYHSKRILVSRHTFGWARQRRRPSWETFGIRSCLRRRHTKARLKLNRGQALKAIQW
jgi:hypothetical protein